MQYNLDLAALTVDEYRELLKQANLLPGRRLLLQNMDENVAAIQAQGVDDLAQLKKRLSSPQKLTAFALATGISEAYLTLLKREIGSLAQTPVPLSSFPGIDGALTAELNEKGIKTSKDYFERGGCDKGELYCLCDLVRINGIGPVAARAFYEAGYRSAAQVARADAAVMLEKVTAVNEVNGYYKAKLGVKDMRFCIDFAALLMKYATESI